MKTVLLSWNIHRCIGMDRRFDPDRVVQVLRHYDADVVFLQEVDRGVPRSRRLWLDHHLAKELGYRYHAWAQAHVLKEGSYGNATLSRWPIVKRRTLDLTIRRKKRRNALYVRVQMPHGAALHTFNWHLGLAASERQEQVARLLASGTLGDLHSDAKVLLVGDTNDWRNLLYRGAGIQKAGFHAWTEHGKRRHIKTFPSAQPVGALDKFFWRGPLREPHLHAGRLKMLRLASDHLPLVAEFSYGKD